MRKRAKHSAYILLFTFVVGSIAAPFSHYAYMALSDYWNFAGMEGMHHGGHSMAHHMHQEPADHNITANDASKEHIGCEYADLFGTFAAADVPVNFQSAPLSLKRTLAEKPVPVVSVTPFTSFQQRGPPTLS